MTKYTGSSFETENEDRNFLRKKILSCKFENQQSTNKNTNNNVLNNLVETTRN